MVLVAALGAPLTSIALMFGPAEYFSLMCLGLIFAVVLAKGSVLKAVAMVLTGLLLSMVGSDLETGAGRMTFDIAELADGIGFANIAMGVFGFAEIIRNLELPPESRDILKTKISGLMPTRQDLIDSSGAIARGTIIGSLVGILPGGGAVIASFAAYTFEKKLSKHPERFGRGAIQGVAAPESANNAAAQTSFIPLLTLGIPPNAVMALMVGAMTIHGFVLGPLMEENLRRAMLIARGDATVFFTRPISAVLLSTAIILLILAALPKMRRRRDEVFVE